MHGDEFHNSWNPLDHSIEWARFDGAVYAQDSQKPTRIYFSSSRGTTATRSLAVFARQFGLKARYVHGHFCLASTWDSNTGETQVMMTNVC